MANTAQQIALDNALVAPKKQVKIRKCNMRIDPEKTQKEPTYQVVLDALALITASVPLDNNEQLCIPIDNRDVKKQEKMYYPIFTKAIIHHFLSKDNSISMRNIMFMHTTQYDSILGTLRFVSKDEDTQVYRALISTVMTTPKIQDSLAYQTYLAFATGAATP
ncbi:hypothetical protein Tco_1102190 [Tanacetum coccineum]